MLSKKLVAVGVAAALVGGAGVLGLRSTGGKASLSVKNGTAAPVEVFVAFGADSKVVDWPACPVTGRLNCKMTVPARGAQDLPLGGRYLNATFSFGGPVGCGHTKAEFNLNNPAWFDIVDVSLVDGFSNALSITVSDPAGSKELGPVTSASGNEKAYGVYPNGCDICVARQKPPCGMAPGKDGCKTGPDQYHPDVPCQWQGSVKGGGTAAAVVLR